MKDKVSRFITVIISLIIILALGFSVYIVWYSIKDLDVAAEPEKFQTQMSTVGENTVDKETIKTPQIIESNPLDNITSENTQSHNIDYGDVNIDKFFYNQLEEPAKIIYKAFERNKEQMKSGNFQVELGNSFDNILNRAGGSDELGKYYQSAIEAYTYDNPDVFYLSPNKIYLNMETIRRGNRTSYNVYINNGTQNNYFIDEFSSISQVNEALNQINMIRNDLLSKRTGNNVNDIKMVHDYLVDNTEYDTSLSKPNIYNMYGALVNKEAVCEGYARAFKYIMDGMNIPCVLAIGQGTNSRGQTENHAWNYIEVDGAWYAIDCTWDDPVVQGGGIVSKTSKYKYFLRGSDEFLKDHTPSGYFTPNGMLFTYPQISINDYKR